MTRSPRASRGVRRSRIVLGRLASLLAAVLLLAQALPVLAVDTAAATTSPSLNMAVDTGYSNGKYVGFTTATQKLTANGGLDWRLWGRSTNSLAGDARKAAGTGISDLTSIVGSPVFNNASILSLGSCCNYKWGGTAPKNLPFAFDWSDGGSPSTSGSTVLGGLEWANSSSPMLGYGFSFSVPASTTWQRLKVWVHANHGTGSLTATLGSLTTTDPGIVANDNEGRIYTFDFTGDGTAGQVLTVAYTLASYGSNNNASNVGIYAAALSSTDFSLATAASSLTVPQGTKATTAVNIGPVASSTGTVSLTASASDPGLTATLSSSSYVIGSAPSPTLTVAASPTVAPGTYSVTVNGTLGYASHATTVSVTVPPPDFQISVAPSSQSVAEGGSATSTLTIAPVGASIGTVSLSTQADPGLTATLSSSSYDLANPPATSPTVTLKADADANPGTYNATITGTLGGVTHSAPVTVTVLQPAQVGVPLLTNAYNASGSTVTLYAGHITALPNTNYTISFASASTCPGGTFPTTGTTTFGSITVTTDANGNAFFASGSTNGVSGTPALGDTFISAYVSGPAGRTSGYSPCVVNSPDNDTWPRALDIPTTGQPTTGTTVDQAGVSRWFKVAVVPGGSVTVSLTGLTKDYDVYLFKDISQTYQAITGETSLTKLSAEFAGSGFSGSGFSGSGFSGSGFSGSGFSGSGFSGSGFSGSGFSGSGFSADSYSGSGFSGSGFSGSGFSGSGFSGSGFSGSGFSGSGFSGSGFSGSGFSAQSFSAAQVYSLVAWSNQPGSSDELTGANTWTNTGYFYIRVNGKNGAYDLQHPFSLKVTVNSNLCSGISDSGSAPGTISNGYSTLILTDTSRFGSADTSGMMTSLGQLAAASNGKVIDLASDSRVHALQAQSDANPGCVYARNLVAQAAKDVVDAYRAGNTGGGVKDVVLAGGDNVVPFFRYPDTSSIGPEVNYFPPVQGTSTSEASLRNNYVLSQDAYGSSRTLSLGPVSFPIPDLPVGRLVETPPEISGMVAAYLAQPTVAPKSSLVTGYDFISDAATSIKGTLDKATGQAGQSLIDPYGASPSSGWTATQLKSALLGQRNDISFLGGHFSANSALAADFSTVMTTADFAASTTDFRNSLIFSIGCHSGYNIVDAQGIPNVTNVLDWPQVFAQKQVTSILGTGYQYGDTDFIEYSERIYSEFARQLTYGSGAVGVGNALLGAKQQYLEQTPNLGDLHEKALLEATLYGIPMLGVNLPNRQAAPSASGTVALSSFSTEPALTTGLRYADISQDTSGSQQHQKTLNKDTGGTLTATWYTGPAGALTTPGAPVLPLYSKTVTAGTSGYVLRGIGFRGGSYTDSGVVPLTGAPGTELQTAHTSFNSPTFYPTQMWSANYFDALTGGGTTTLFTTPAQHMAPNPGDPNDVLRLYSNLNLRLFYSNSTAAGSKSTAPVIYGVTSTLDASGNTAISTHVTGDPNADVQQVWVTYTEPGSGTWKSFDLTRDTADPSLWNGSKLLLSGTLFMVQAANGFGLVSQNDNAGSLWLAGVAASTAAASGITIAAPKSGTYGTSASITATLTSGNQAAVGKQVIITLGQATRSGTTDVNGQVQVTIPLQTSAGDYPVTAAFIGDQSTLPTSGLGTFTVTKATSTTKVTCPASVAYTGQPLAPCTAITTGTDLNQPLVVTYTANVNVGTVTASATFYGDTAHTDSSDSTTFSIVKANQSITVSPNPIPDHTFGDAPFVVTGSATSGLPVAFTVGAGSSCTYDAATILVTITGAGTCTINADQAGNGNYSAAPTVSQTFAIAKAAATLTIDPASLAATYDGTAKSVTVTSTPAGLAGVTVTYAGSPTPPVDAGTYAVVATLSNPNYAASDATGSLVIAPATQTITFGALAGRTYGDAPFTVSATASSGLAVTFAAAPAGVCTIDATNSVTIVGAGTCTITASQAGSTNYKAAASVSQSFTVAKAAATLTIDPSTLSATYDGTAKSVTVTTSPIGLDGVTVTYNGSATAPKNAGSYPVVASLNNPNYQAPNATGTLVIAQASATMTLSNLNQTYDGNPKPITVTTNPSGLTGVTVTYSSSSYPASTTAPSAPGSYTAVATLSNQNYAAPQVTGTLVISQLATTMTVGASGISPNPVPQYSDVFTLVANLPSTATGSVAFTFNGTSAGSGTVSGGVASVSVNAPALGAGTYPVKATYTPGPTSPYAGVTVTTTVTVSREGQGQDATPDGSARVDYTGTQFVPVGTAPTLTATLLQSQGPEGADGTFVDYSKVNVYAVFNLYPAGCDTSCPTAATFTSSNVKISNASNWSKTGAGTASVRAPKNLAEGAYMVTVSIVANNYILPLNATSTLTIATTNGNYMNGGGYLSPDPLSNAQNAAGSFGFNVKSGNSGPTGSVIYVYRLWMDVTTAGPDPVTCASLSATCRAVDVIVRSAPVGNFVPGQSSTDYKSAFDTGSAIVQYVDALDGTHETAFELAQTAFRLDATDYVATGGTDYVGMTVYRADNSVFHQAYMPATGAIAQTGIDVATNQGPVAAGSIVVKPK